MKHFSFPWTVSAAALVVDMSRHVKLAPSNQLVAFMFGHRVLFLCSLFALESLVSLHA